MQTFSNGDVFRKIFLRHSARLVISLLMFNKGDLMAVLSGQKNDNGMFRHVEISGVCCEVAASGRI
jgi:hypothetical protein